MEKNGQIGFWPILKLAKFVTRVARHKIYIIHRIFPCIRDPFCPFYFALEIGCLLYTGVFVCAVLQ